MKRTFTELNVLLAECNKLHAASMDEARPEEETDELYAQYWEKAESAAAIIISLLAIDKNTALKMVLHRRNEIASLLARAA